MDNYTKSEIDQALQIVCSLISRCEQAWPKFAEGTSQHTLLKNRIKALNIVKCLLMDEHGIGNYSKEELTWALRPVSSIISKCEKAQWKFAQGTSHYARYKHMIQAMYLSKSLMESQIIKRG